MALQPAQGRVQKLKDTMLEVYLGILGGYHGSNFQEANLPMFTLLARISRRMGTCLMNLLWKWTVGNQSWMKPATLAVFVDLFALDENDVDVDSTSVLAYDSDAVSHRL